MPLVMGVIVYLYPLFFWSGLVYFGLCFPFLLPTLPPFHTISPPFPKGSFFPPSHNSPAMIFSLRREAGMGFIKCGFGKLVSCTEWIRLNSFPHRGKFYTFFPFLPQLAFTFSSFLAKYIYPPRGCLTLTPTTPGPPPRKHP